MDTTEARPVRHTKTLAAVVAAVVLLCCAAWPFARAHMQAVAVLDQVTGQRVPWIVGEVSSSPVETHDLSFTVEGAHGKQTVRARVYEPRNLETQGKAPGLVIFHGVHHLGIDEPRLMSFAASMASCGIRVLTPELPNIKDYHVSEDSVETIGESAKWFATQAGGAASPVGVMGLSFSGGLALVAAADPRYQPYFRFVFTVGSQDSMGRVTEYYRTGSDARPDGSVELLPAHEYGPLVLEYEYLEDFVPVSDLAAIRAVLRAHLYEEPQAESAARKQLSEAQTREATQLMDTTSEATRAKIAAVLAKHTRELTELSPRGRLGKFATPVYLLHGEGDNIIPAAETLWMASELPSDEMKAMLVSPVLSHVSFTGQPGAWDEWQLVHFFALVMDAAEKN